MHGNTNRTTWLCMLALLYLSCAALPLKAQTDSLGSTPDNDTFISRLPSTQAFRMTCIGVPLVAGGLAIKSTMPTITCNIFLRPSCWPRNTDTKARG